MNKQNVGVAIIVIGLIIIIGNIPTEFKLEEFKSLPIGLIIILVGVMYVTKHRRNER